jgi:hypothetical protein
VAGPVGLVERLADRKKLVQRSERARASIRDEDTVPVVPPGADVDLYPFQLSGLFAQRVRWNPRPVFQSYAVYTPALARLNADHLRGADAPHEVLFSISPIDYRLPALEDGASWVPLLEGYRITGYDALHDYLRMRHRQSAVRLGSSERPLRLHGNLGRRLDLPDERTGWLATFDVHPSWKGQLRNLLWKTPSMLITLTLEDGRELQFRFVPEMAAGQFLLSPFVQNARNFAGLAAPNGSNGAATPPAVRAIRLDAESSPDMWKSGYSVDLTSVVLPVTADRRGRPGSPRG